MALRILLFSVLISSLVTAQDIINIGLPINSMLFAEHGVSLSGDGKTMVFQSDRTGRWRLYESSLHDSAWTEPNPIDSINNYHQSDIFIGGAFLSYDGKSLYFTSDMFGSLGSMDIFISEKKEGKWGTPKNLSFQINTKQYEGFPSLTSDNRILYFIRKNLTKKENEACYSIYISEKDSNDIWSNPTALDFPVNTQCEDAPRISPDGKTLIFSSIRNGGKGKYDLYRCNYNKDLGWSKVLPLDYINTEYNDKLISITPNQEYIYFSNNGGFSDDIYCSKIPFIERLQKKMIVSGNILDNETGAPIVAQLSITNVRNNKIVTEVYSSDADGTFSVELPEGEEYHLVIKKDDYVVLEQALDLSFVTEPKKQIDVTFNNEAYQRTKKTAIIKGSIIDNETGEPIVAKLSITNVRNNKIVTEVFSDEADGTYVVDLPKNETYKVYVTAKGLIMKESIIIDNLDKPIIFDTPIKMNSISNNTSFVIENIYFDTDSFNLNPASFLSLDQIVDLLKQNRNIKVEISAHTDNVGDPSYNMKLSQARANGVVKYLISKSNITDNLIAKGYGETIPIANNNTIEGKTKNRRVEFKILKLE